MSGKVQDASARPKAETEARRDLPPAAQRALKEAEARRAQAKSATSRELNGRGGLDPVRYGDWEVKGLASDFRVFYRAQSRRTEDVAGPERFGPLPQRPSPSIACSRLSASSGRLSAAAARFSRR